MVKPIVSIDLKGGGQAVWTNSIIQIGYDYILATGVQRKKLSDDLNERLGRLDKLSYREVVLQKIRDDFGISDAEVDNESS